MKYLFLVLIMLTSTSIFAGEFPDDSYSQEMFAGDLVVAFTDYSPYETKPHSDVDRRYLDPAEIPQAGKAALQALKPGVIRGDCKDWGMNSSLSMNEYCHGLLPDGRTLAVRIIFRPAAMPESVFSDATARRAWIHDHKPDVAPTDILMKVSKPFATVYGLD